MNWGRCCFRESLSESIPNAHAAAHPRGGPASVKTFSFPSKVSRPEKLPEPLFCDGLSLLTPNGVCVFRLPAAIVGPEQALVKQNL